MSPRPVPFMLEVPESDIADLRRRLETTRLPDQAPGEPWAHGTDLDYLRRLLEYWRRDFDWRAAEARLNAFPQFRLELGGIDLHYLHVQGNGPNPQPLLLSHGWPGSVFEFIEIIPRLTDPARFGGDPADALTVIAPSLPGFGLSFHPGQQRFSCEAIADLLLQLMTVLGHERFAAQGGDWGSFIIARMAALHPERLRAIHLNMLPLPRDPASLNDEDPEEARYRRELADFLNEEAGYQAIQGTRPQTLAYGLTDSPAGLAAWIIEKFRAWSDCDGEIESVFYRDRLLDNIGLYWFTCAIGSSFFPYYARLHGPWPVPVDRSITVPTAYAAFPKEIVRPPRSVAERVFSNIRRWTAMERGGHFAAMEQPEALARDVHTFLRDLRRA